MADLTDKRVSRRTVAVGAAWTVPVVVAAGAAPAFATSPGGPIDPSFCQGSFCKHSKANAYHAAFCFDNTSDQEIDIDFTEFHVGGNIASGDQLEPSSLTVPPNSKACTYVDGLDFPDMQEARATLYFTYEVDGNVVFASVSTPPGNQQVRPCGTGSASGQPKEWPHDPDYDGSGCVTP